MNDSTRAARALVAALVAQGVRDVVYAPGSRSAPIAYALHEAQAAGWLSAHVRTDERVAAFLALGIARVRPAAVVTTSGTAAANLHPAILEAHHSRLPLLAITADRPAELRDVGANQTTTQPGLFAGAVRADVDLPAGLTDAALTNQVARVVAALTGRGGAPGPAHLNVAFRDPLTPDEPWAPGAPPAPHPLVVPTNAPPVPYPLDDLADAVVVAGADAGPAAPARALGLPILAEPSSGLRGEPNAIAGYRRMLAQAHPLVARIRTVIVLGRPTLSRQVQALLARADVRVIVVDPLGTDWVDVTGNADLVVPALAASAPGEADWLAAWHAAGAPDVPDAAPLTAAGAVARGLRIAPADLATLVLGASMAIRHADVHGPAGADLVGARIVANRGLAGIDGTLATAAGLALATGAPARAVVGDLTFLHDLGGLALGAGEAEPDLQVVLLNDGGGAIFGTLEHARHPETLGRWFTTPVPFDAAALAAGLGARHRAVRTAAELDAALAEPIRGRAVLEVDLTT